VRSVKSRRDRFEEIAPNVIEPVRRFLARRTDAATADDVLAETLLVCWRRAEELPDEPLPWVYAVARNCLRNAERSARRQERVAARIAAVDPPAETTPGPGQAPGEDGDDEELVRALAALRPDEAELLRLWAWEQLTPAEIATVLDITSNAASIRLHRARGKLRDQLRHQHGKTGAAAGHEESREGRRP
jgi:RNA polymerase sigma-70 factor (ECF subfamily)